MVFSGMVPDLVAGTTPGPRLQPDPCRAEGPGRSSVGESGLGRAVLIARRGAGNALLPRTRAARRGGVERCSGDAPALVRAPGGLRPPRGVGQTGTDLHGAGVGHCNFSV